MITYILKEYIIKKMKKILKTKIRKCFIGGWWGANNIIESIFILYNYT